MQTATTGSGGAQTSGDTAGKAQDKAQQAAGQAQERASELADQAQEKAQDLVGQARSQARDQLEQRTTQAADQIDQQVSDLRKVSQSLREQGSDAPAKMADRLAEYTEKVGTYLRDSDADRLLNDAEDFGRRRPWAAAGAGLALGLAASRFLKASSRQRYSARSGPQTPGRASLAPPALGAGSGAAPVQPTPASAPGSASIGAPANGPGNGGPVTPGHTPIVGSSDA